MIPASFAYHQATSVADAVRMLGENPDAKILAGGIAARALDIDIVKIHGYGYPAWRGGPMPQQPAIDIDEFGKGARP